MSYSTEITAEKICALIKSEFKMKQLPMDESFHKLGFSHADLIRIQTRIAKAFGRTVNAVFYGDTVNSINDKLTSKPNTNGRSYH